MIVLSLSFFSFFTDPVLRAPTLGSMFMCFASALIGVVVFLRKESLLGESLSHASYPGVALGILFSFTLIGSGSFILACGVLVGSFLSAYLGLWCIHLLQTKMKVKSDAALCLILSTFFGVGITLASRLQFTHSSLYRQIQTYLYGQAATMTDVHIMIYGALSLVVLTAVVLLYKEIMVMTMDRDYAKSIGIPTHTIDMTLFVMIVLAVVIGIRSVGVVLMSAMLIAPAIAARQYSHRLWIILLLSSLFGLVSGFLGNYLSIRWTDYLQQLYPDDRIGLPTGPMIVLVASIICIFSLLFAPERGLVLRQIRAIRFRNRCVRENILKAMWREGEGAIIPTADLFRYQPGSKFFLKLMVRILEVNGWVERYKNKRVRLTHAGYQRAVRIVRLHRLWEVYLADYMDVGAERVHRSAEEMEHIITPELELELVKLLENPVVDPHHQPIPQKEEL